LQHLELVPALFTALKQSRRQSLVAASVLVWLLSGVRLGLLVAVATSCGYSASAGVVAALLESAWLVYGLQPATIAAGTAWQALVRLVQAAMVSVEAT